MQTLKRDTTVITLMNEQWSPEVRERYVVVDLYDRTLGIPWPIGRRAAIVSDLDSTNPSLPRIVDDSSPRRAAAPSPTRLESPEPPEPRKPFTVLFVCTANICRSAYADVAARAVAPRGVEFGSAGTRALVGQGIDPPMADQLHGLGNPEAHRARQLTRAMAHDADLILTMAAEHRRYILDEWPALGRKTFVFGHAARVLAQLKKDVPLDGLAEHLWNNRPVEASDDIRDPYRQGAEAAEFAASTIDSFLEVLNRALRERA